MSIINWDSIENKVDRYLKSSRMKRQINEAIDDYMLGKVGIVFNGSRPLPPSLAADKFIQVLCYEIESCNINRVGGGYENGGLGNTAVEALQRLSHSDPIPLGDGRYNIYIWFDDDLKRESLVPEIYEGVDNIAALLNSGYSAGNTVYGVWKGHGTDKIASLQERSGAHFIEQAIRDFMGNYASDYGVIEIKVDDVYK